MPEDQNSQVLKVLNECIYDIQQLLNKRLNMRPIPKIRFVQEEKTTEAARIEKLLENINKKNV